MSQVAFFDTNVLIYMHDSRVPHKQETARRLFRRHFYARTFVISTQVLQEFYVTVSKEVFNITSGRAKEITMRYAELDVLAIQPAHILEAVDLHVRRKLSFWDSLIVVAARAAGASTLYSEDLGHGQIYDGVRVENPFVAQ